MIAHSRITRRDQIRLDALATIAGTLVGKFGAAIAVGGSYAISLHLSHRWRVPNDLDLITSNPALVEPFIDACRELSAVELPTEEVATFTGTIRSLDTLVALAEHSDPTFMLDLVPCQLTVSSRGDGAFETIDMAGHAVRLLPLPDLLADKLHALWKVRTTDLVSTRVRDLHDFGTLSSEACFDEVVDQAIPIALTMGAPRRPLGHYPREWAAGWRDLNRASGKALQADEVWQSLRRLVLDRVPGYANES